MSQAGAESHPGPALPLNCIRRAVGVRLRRPPPGRSEQRAATTVTNQGQVLHRGALAALDPERLPVRAAGNRARAAVRAGVDTMIQASSRS